MTEITIQTEAGLVKLSHSGQELKLVAGQGDYAKRWWQSIGLRIGVDGHTLYLKDCSLRDVAVAFGEELSNEERKRLLKLMIPLPPIPVDATP